MRAGFALPQLGPAAGPEGVVKVAQQAETLGYASVWVIERLLYPLHPQTPYPGTPDGSLPEVYKRVFDPLATLAFVAARTSRIALGTMEQIKEDVAAAQQLGVHEIILDPTFSPGVRSEQDFLAMMERLRSVV